MAAGLKYEEYWGDIQPRIVNKYVEAYNKRLEDFMLTEDMANHVLGQYIGAVIADAFSKGKSKYPEKPQLVEHYPEIKKQQQNPVRKLTREEIEAWIDNRRRERAEEYVANS